MPLLTVLPPSHHTFNLPELQIRDVADFQHTIAPIQQKEIDTLTKRLLDRVSQSPPPGCTAIQPIFILIPPPTNFRPVSAPLVEDAQTTHQQQLLRRKESKLAKQQGAGGGEEKKKKQPQKKTTTTTATGKRRGRPPNKKVNLLEPMPPRLPPPPVPVPPVHKLRQPRPMSDSDSDDDDEDDENDTANKTKKHKAEEPKKVAAATLPLMLPTSICTLPTQPTKKCLQPVPFAFGFFFEPRKQQQQQQQKSS